jgi:hypothetical protein
LQTSSFCREAKHAEILLPPNPSVIHLRPIRSDPPPLHPTLPIHLTWCGCVACFLILSFALSHHLLPFYSTRLESNLPSLTAPTLSVSPCVCSSRRGDYISFPSTPSSRFSRHQSFPAALTCSPRSRAQSRRKRCCSPSPQDRLRRLVFFFLFASLCARPRASQAILAADPFSLSTGSAVLFSNHHHLFRQTLAAVIPRDTIPRSALPLNGLGSPNPRHGGLLPPLL